MDITDLDIADSVLELIGKTPMVRLSRMGAGLACPVVIKLETTNPGGSSKDRPAVAMIDAAEKAGLLAPGGTIIEPTSGNTGVGLAIVAAQRGYKCVFVMTDKVSTEKVSLLRAYGAEVVVCSVAVPPEDPQSYYSTAERLMNETPGAFQPNQYFNPANPQAHYETTGPEIWEQTKGRITHFVAGAGTGGTISGVGRYLKEQNPNVTIVVGDPEGSVYSGGSGRPYLVEGVGEDFWPDTYHPDVVDATVPVSDADSFAMAHRVTREEGLLIGGSGGTAVAAALEVAAGLTADDLVVVLVPDSGRGYLTKVFESYEEGSLGAFVTEDVKLTSAKNDQGDLCYQISMMTWLAPYDLGISQKVSLSATPAEDEHALYAVWVDIHRESGDVASWQRINRRFLSVLRKRFLVWRTLSQQLKDEYAATGRKLTSTQEETKAV